MNKIIGNTLQYPNIVATCIIQRVAENEDMLLQKLTEENVRAIKYWATVNDIEITNVRRTSVVTKVSIHHLDKLHDIKQTILGLTISVMFEL